MKKTSCLTFTISSFLIFFLFVGCSSRIIKDKNDLPSETVFLKESEQFPLPVILGYYYNYRVRKYANTENVYFEKNLKKAINLDKNLNGKTATIVAYVPVESGRSFNNQHYMYQAYYIAYINNQYLFTLEDDCNKLKHYFKNKDAIDKRMKEIKKENEYYSKFAPTIRSKYSDSECINGGFDYYLVSGNEASIFPQDNEFVAVFNSPSYAKVLKEHIKESKDNSVSPNPVVWSMVCGKWVGFKTFLTRAGFYKQLKVLQVNYIELNYPDDDRIYEKGK